MAGIPAIWRPVLTLVLLLALPQVQAAPWTVWACEGGTEQTTGNAPDSEAGCCKYEGDGEGRFTTDARRCGSRALQ